jgi:hypothetical protein
LYWARGEGQENAGGGQFWSFFHECSGGGEIFLPSNRLLKKGFFVILNEVKELQLNEKK